VITIKSKREFAKMAKAGATVAAIHEAVREAAVPGVSLMALEEISARIIAERGCTSSFHGYHGTYPATLCLSPNDVIVHGIPSDRRLEEGDILAVDAGAIFEGFHGDAAFTMPIGSVRSEAQRLIDVTEEALWAGIRRVRKGGHLGDIGAAVAAVGQANGYGVAPAWPFASSPCSTSAPVIPLSTRTVGPFAPPTARSRHIGSTRFASRRMVPRFSPPARSQFRWNLRKVQPVGNISGVAALERAVQRAFRPGRPRPRTLETSPLSGSGSAVT
jgi:methionine aminopeptidase